MSDNPQPESAAFFALPAHRVLVLEGRDAAAFAQAQFMNDVAALGPGQWQWSGWLTPKGRLVALFALLRRQEDAFWLVLPDADADELAAQLRRFVFRSKVAIALPGHGIAGALAAPAQARGAQAVAGDAGVDLDMTGEGGARTLRVLSADAAPAATGSEAVARWTALDLEHGLPRLPAAQAGQWTPQQLSLDRLRAFSVKKGCYPGQEIVARTHFLGQAKRHLVLFEADAAVAPGSEVGDGTRALGTVVSAAHGADSHRLLAVLPIEHDGAGLSAGDVVLRPRALRDGLAR